MLSGVCEMVKHHTGVSGPRSVQSGFHSEGKGKPLRVFRGDVPSFALS